jgi:hypothetical protein
MELADFDGFFEDLDDESDKKDSTENISRSSYFPRQHPFIEQ